MICKLNEKCSAQPGMCVHEKAMFTMALMAVAGIAAYLFIS